METYQDLIKEEQLEEAERIETHWQNIKHQLETSSRCEHQFENPLRHSRVISNAQEETKMRFTAPASAWMRRVVKKNGINLDEMQEVFLGNMADQFKRYEMQVQEGGKRSVNYVCFLFSYFQKVSEEDWPEKNRIIIKLAKALPKSEKTRIKANKRFKKWWATISMDLHSFSEHVKQQARG